MKNRTDHVVRKSIDLHEIVQTIRKEAKVTQSEVAQRLGISPGSYSEYERNLLQGSVSRLFKLLGALNVELVLRSKPSDTAPAETPTIANDPPRMHR